MAAREHRIFFMDTPFSLAFQASDVHFTCPLQLQGSVLVVEWAHRSDHDESIYELFGQLNTIYGAFMEYLRTIWRT